MGRPLLSKGDTSMSFPRRPRIFTRSQILLIAFLAFAFAVPTFAHAQTETTLFNFGPAAPANPYNGLTLDAAGNLYGVAYYSQAVYQLHRSNGAWQANVLYTFTKGKDGGYPSSPPVIGSDGSLYGVAAGGGTHGQGVVYKLTRGSGSTWKETVLYSFTGGRDGAAPGNNLVFDNAGKLYGTTASGGDSNPNSVCQIDYQGCGTVFELSPEGTQWKFRLLSVFTGKFDAFGPAFLAFDKASNLYVSSSGPPSGFEGQSGPGIIFKLVPHTSGLWTQSLVYYFGSGSDGGDPGNIVFDKSGNIYGAAFNDGIPNCQTGIGAEGCGEIFKLSRQTNGKYSLSVLYAFTGYSDGAFPEGIILSRGKIYGDAQQGGSGLQASGNGVLFQLSPNPDGTFSESTLHTFDGSDGKWPDGFPVVDPAGNLYGITTYGGTNSGGVVWEYTP
jgi:hypothetical protein